MTRALLIVALLAAPALAQDPKPAEPEKVDPAKLDKEDITARARELFGGFDEAVRFFAGTPRGGGGPVLLATSPRRDLHVVETHVDVLQLLGGAIETSEQALALCRFFTAPPAGPSLLQEVELRPKVVTADATWTFPALAVKRLAGAGPRVTRDPQEGFRVERVCVNLLRLAAAPAVEGREAELSKDQADAFKAAPGATVHELRFLTVTQEHVLPRNYGASFPEREERLLVVRTPRPAR